ncbi:hypothetical protein, partial [Bradyrhizobium sp. AUGA SZCCT0283]|uniref:hypothetical protein n=1 Tax=Bradyrhizobium sp. AUGA SZCCT0283 TaxID=2807671 RepID=UPI001BA56D01
RPSCRRGSSLVACSFWGWKNVFTQPGSFSEVTSINREVRQIVLQNSKVAAFKIFGENLKRKEVDDSHSFSRATEVAHEFGARR